MVGLLCDEDLGTTRTVQTQQNFYVAHVDRIDRKQEPINRSLHLPYKPYETTFAPVFLFLETVGLLDWRALYAIQYNIIQYDTAQHNSTQNNTIQCTTLEFKLAWGENCSKNRKIRAKAPGDGLLP